MMSSNSTGTLESSTATKWEVRSGVIYITLPASEGVTGQQWSKHLESKNFQVADDAQNLLKSEDFKPTTRVVYRLAILPSTFWQDSELIMRKIRAEGQRCKWGEINPEAVCILRETLSNNDLKKMGLWYIAGVHEPIKVHGHPHFLYASRGVGAGLLGTYGARPDDAWCGGVGGFTWSVPRETRFHGLGNRFFGNR